jgi:hypothetical protein
MHGCYQNHRRYKSGSKRDELPRVDGEIVHLSYSLTETLVNILTQDFSKSRFIEFVSQSSRSDGDESAAQHCLGIFFG